MRFDMDHPFTCNILSRRLLWGRVASYTNWFNSMNNTSHNLDCPRVIPLTTNSAPHCHSVTPALLQSRCPWSHEPILLLFPLVVYPASAKPHRFSSLASLLLSRSLLLT